jgi:hypothetical protein
LGIDGPRSMQDEGFPVVPPAFIPDEGISFPG